MSSFGFTASFAIAVSLLVSFTLTPDAELALHQDAAAAREGDKQRSFQGFALFPFPGSPLYTNARMVHGAPQGHGGDQRGGDR